MKIASLPALILINLVRAHDGEDGKWLLTTYSEDDACSKVVYVSMLGARCPESDSCTIDDDDDGVFEKSVGGGCVTDRDAYLQTVFNGAPYLKIEMYSTNCTDENEESAEIVGYLADGECHPNEWSHFKVAEGDSGTTSVFMSGFGCDYQYWNETWAAETETELNTGACVTDKHGTSWKAYLITNGSTSTSSSGPSSTVSTSSSSSADTPSATTATETPTSSSSPSAVVTTTAFLLCSTLVLGTMAL